MNACRNALYGAVAIVVFTIFLPSRSYAIIAAVKDLQDVVDRAQATNTTNSAISAELTAKLKTAIETISEGNTVVSNLNNQVAILEKQKTQLQKEKAQLEQIQTTLTSGLIGAVVTAIVAIAGALLKTKNSKVDRDLKRLEVVEKMNELTEKGVALPPDIAKTYRPGKAS